MIVTPVMTKNTTMIVVMMMMMNMITRTCHGDRDHGGGKAPKMTMRTAQSIIQILFWLQQPTSVGWMAASVENTNILGENMFAPMWQQEKLPPLHCELKVGSCRLSPTSH